MTLEIKVLAWDRHKNVVGLNRFMGFLPLDVYQHLVNFHSSVTYLHTISTPFHPHLPLTKLLPGFGFHVTW
jgi:hypothetical protein